MDNHDALKDLKSKRRIIVFLGLPMWVLGLYFAIAEKEWIMGFLSLLLLVASVFAIVKANKLIRGTLVPYRPGKGFWYYRMSAQSKRAYITAAQCVLLLLLIGFWVMDYFNGYTAATAVGGIIVLQVLVKRRIKLHTEVDEASLLELEELGIIRQGEVITSLYKDFEKWSSLSGNAKVLALTPERLIVIIMASAQAGARYEIRLREITGLSIISEGKYGQGVIVTLKLADDTVINLRLEGESQQDSPEQFIQALLKGLDRVYQGAAGSAALEQKARPHPEYPKFSGKEPLPQIRHLDLHEAPVSQTSASPSGRADRIPVEPNTNKRRIEF